MTITKKMKGSTMILALEGRMDSEGVRNLEDELEKAFESATQLVFDLKKLSYISSAGLRVLLSAQRRMNEKGGIVIRNVPQQVMEVLNLVGFASLLNIE